MLEKPKRKRLDRNRFQGLAIPKTLREIDRAALATPRSPFCEFCGRTDQAIHRHHLKTKGSGGSDRNTIDLCVTCHTRVHAGRISKAELLAKK